MFEEVLPKPAKNALAILGKSNVLKSAYLAGGSALALQLGHRISVDFDFFTDKGFDVKMFTRQLSNLPISFRLERIEWGTILGYLGKTRFSLFFYDYPLLGKSEQYLGIKIASVEDIAAMKLAAISERGTKRDFIDIYFISAQEDLFSLEDILRLYERKFKVLRQNKVHILKSLTYFQDAEGTEMPKMLKPVKWLEVKKFFKRETRYLTKKMVE